MSIITIQYVNRISLTFLFYLPYDRRMESCFSDQYIDTYIFETFFYNRYLEGYKYVEKWTKDVDIFTKYYIFFPIHIRYETNFLLCT
jgi:Ulp1 family protease